MLAAIFAQAEPASAEQLTRDSAILGEQFYFFTVVLMWLIHAGFMSYEAGVARRKNVMATAMKNILTIAVVTPTFYYFGWWIYNCNQAGLPIGPNSSDFTSAACQGGIPWSDAFGPNLTNNINLIFFLAFLLFSWTTASIMSGALIERARLSAYLVLAVLLGSVVWILDAAWGWSAGGWLTMRFGFHDSIASGVVHGVAGAFTLGVLFNLGPRIGKYTMRGPRTRLQTAQPAHHRARADVDIHRLLRLLRGLPGDRVDLVPRLGEHLPQPDDARLDHDGDHDGLRRRLHRRLLRQPGRPVLDDLRRPGRRDRRVRRRRRLRADGRLPAVDAHRRAGRLRRRLDRDEDAGRRCGRGGRGARRRRLPRACSGSGYSPPGYPTGINNVESSIGGQLMGMVTFLPLGFLSGWVASFILRKANLLRVPPEVELAGLDLVEYGTLVYPEMGVIKEQVVEPDGTLVETATVGPDPPTNGRPGRRSRR